MIGWEITSKETINSIERESTTLSENQVRIKITMSALTSTDAALYFGLGEKYPIIPCRAATGIISESTSNQFERGQRVIISPYINTNLKPQHSNTDQEKTVLFSDIDILGVHRDGFLRDFIVLPAENVVAIPEKVEDYEALFVEHIALAIKTLEVLNIQNNHYVVILGGNSLCDICAQLVSYYHGISIIVDTNNNLLEVCKENGALYTMNPTDVDCINRIFEITGGKMADHIIFDSRARLPFQSALSLARKKGTIALMGFNIFADKLDLNISPVLKKQLTFTGINNGYNEISSAINILANKIIKINSLISHTIDFNEAPEVIKKLAQNPSSYRSIIVKH